MREGYCTDTEKYFVLNRSTTVAAEYELTVPQKNAVKILERDIRTALKPARDGAGKRSEIILRHSQTGKLPEECYRIDFDENTNTLFILSDDDLGAVYGLLHISECYLGFHPFFFWTEQIPQPAKEIQVAKAPFESKPARIRYRGWFVNDEVLLLGWGRSPYCREVWEPVFETLLRCGGNMVIPGTGKTSLENRQLASDMGLYIAHHHAEPLGAEMFSSVYPDKEPNYDKNAPLFEALWEKAVRNQKDKKVIWALGFRGQGDCPFWGREPEYNTPEKRGERISSIIRRQAAIVRKYVRNPVFVTYLYGETMDLYRKGCLDIPENIIKVWSDNGYGKMVSRRQGNVDNRVDALPQDGRSRHDGVYYHVTFHDLQASNHLTMFPNSPELIKNELQKAFRSGAGEFLIVNCGNIRPHLYFLDLVRRMWTDGTVDIEKHRIGFCSACYPESGRRVAEYFKKYSELPVQYGPFSDQRAGEQFYQYPARYLMEHLIQGRQNEPEERLLWATGKVPYPRQVEWYRGKCAEKMDAWREFCRQGRELQKEMPPAEGQLFSDTVLQQGILHFSGCSGAVEMCISIEKFLNKNYLEAFLCANRARRAFQLGVDALRSSEHGKWKNFYRNDCLTNLSLTVYCMDVLRKYYRVFGDAPDYVTWERKYLMDKSQKKIALQTTTSKQLSDDELFERLSHQL